MLLSTESSVQINKQSPDKWKVISGRLPHPHTCSARVTESHPELIVDIKFRVSNDEERWLMMKSAAYRFLIAQQSLVGDLNNVASGQPLSDQVPAGQAFATTWTTGH